jgi:hypothetical protein
MTRYILIVGQKHHGKTTTAHILHDLLGQGHWWMDAFANKIKEVICMAFGVTLEFIEEWKSKDENPPGFTCTMRQLMQFIGEQFRQRKPRVWIDAVLEKDGDDPFANVIIQDGRHFEEIDAVHEKKGLVIAVFRPGFVNYDPHPSEAQVHKIYTTLGLNEWSISKLHIGRPVNAVIVNNGTEENLRRKLETLILPLVKEKLQWPGPVEWSPPAAPLA